MAASSRRSSASGPVLRSLSPSGRFYSSQSSPRSSSASAFASSSTGFSSRSTTFLHRSASPPRVNMYGSSPPTSSIRFSLDRPVSPNRSISVAPRGNGNNNHHHQVVKRQITQKRTCMCSPTSHPGSFRCSLHKGFGSPHSVVPYAPNRLNARRSAMTNSLVRIGGVEGDLVRRALAALIRPSSHSQRRRADFQARPSRLSLMSKAEDSWLVCQWKWARGSYAFLPYSFWDLPETEASKSNRMRWIFGCGWRRQILAKWFVIWPVEIWSGDLVFFSVLRWPKILDRTMIHTFSLCIYINI